MRAGVSELVRGEVDFLRVLLTSVRRSSGKSIMNSSSEIKEIGAKN
jgi:hypothetical protein